jgi:hypothetical protein
LVLPNTVCDISNRSKRFQIRKADSRKALKSSCGKAFAEIRFAWTGCVKGKTPSIFSASAALIYQCPDFETGTPETMKKASEPFGPLAFPGIWILA